MAAEAAFVDTNLLVYASRARSAFHPRATSALQQAKDNGEPLWFSRQIVREYLAVVTRPQPNEPALSNADANIVATMLVHGIARLLTFNGADFRGFGGLIEVVAP